MTGILLAERRTHSAVLVTPARAVRLARIHGLTRARYAAADIARITGWSLGTTQYEQRWLRRHDDHIAEIVRHGATS